MVHKVYGEIVSFICSDSSLSSSSGSPSNSRCTYATKESLAIVASSVSPEVLQLVASLGVSNSLIWLVVEFIY